MAVSKTLKILWFVALGLLCIAILIWGLEMTMAVGNLHFHVKVLEQRINILSPDNGSRKHHGSVQDESP